MDDKIKVSICVPVYNASKYIVRCCKSLFGQTYTNIEFVIVNDCSTDSSLSLIETTISEYSERISQVKIINHSVNKGSAASRNTALDNSTGDYILWVDSDDYLELDAVEKLVRCQNQTGADHISYSAYRYYRTHKEKVVNEHFKTPSDLLCAYLKGNVDNYLWTRFVATNIYNNFHLRFIEGQNMGEDMYLLPQLAYHATKLAFVDDVLYHYDCTNIGSYTYSFSREKSEENFKSFYSMQAIFAPLSDKYKDLLEINHLKRLLRCKLSLSMYDDKEYFQLIQSRLDCVDAKYYKYIEMRDYPLLLLKKQMLVKMYGKIGRFFFQLIKNVK